MVAGPFSILSLYLGWLFFFWCASLLKQRSVALQDESVYHVRQLFYLRSQPDNLLPVSLNQRQLGCGDCGSISLRGAGARTLIDLIGLL